MSEEALVPLDSPEAINVVKTALHFVDRVREELVAIHNLRLVGAALGYLSDIEGELLSFLPEEDDGEDADQSSADSGY